MAAWLAQPYSANSNFTDLKLSSDQVIERYSGGDEVAAGVSGSKIDFIIALQSFQSFGFNQGQFEVRLWFEERALTQSVTIALEAHSWDCQDLLDGVGRGLRC